MIQTTEENYRSENSGEFLAAVDPQKVLVEREKDRGSSKSNGLLLAKFEFLTSKDLEAARAVITSTRKSTDSEQRHVSRSRSGAGGISPLGPSISL